MSWMGSLMVFFPFLFEIFSSFLSSLFTSSLLHLFPSPPIPLMQRTLAALFIAIFFVQKIITKFENYFVVVNSLLKKNI